MSDRISVGVRVTLSGGGIFALDRRDIRAALRRAGGEVAALTRSLRSAGGGGRTYTQDGKTWTASAPGQPPARVSGTLAHAPRGQLTASGLTVRVFDAAAAFYGRFVEFGAKGVGRPKGGQPRSAGRGRRRGVGNPAHIIAPRPSLTLALGQREGSIATRLRSALEGGVAFIRLKP